MATRPIRREEALKAINEERLAYSRLLKQAEAAGDRNAYQQYSQKISELDAKSRATGGMGEFGSGVASAAIGMLTGLPDIVISGYNAAARPTTPIPTGRELALKFAGMPAEATSEEGSMLYGTPEVATAAAGLAQLGYMGVTGLASFLKNRKVTALKDKIGKEDFNRLEDLMVMGQRSKNPAVAAQIEAIRKDPKYAEFFFEFDKEATKRTMQGMSPRPSRLDEPTAAKNAMTALEDRLTAMKDARSKAGNDNFGRAIELGGDRAILNTDTLLKQVRTLKQEYGNQNTPSAQAALRWLQKVEDDIVPSFNVPSRAGTSFTSPTSARDTLTNAPIAGKEVTYNIPGSEAYTVTQAPRKLTVQETQAKLKEWGRASAAEDKVVPDLSLTDEKRINSILFGAVKDDVAASKAVASVADKKALGALDSAREQTKRASEAYSDAVSQGIPAKFKDRPINSIDFEELSTAYKDLNPAQRRTFREWVGENKQEALQAIDKKVYDDFVNKHYGPLPSGEQGINLKSLAEDWNKLKQTSPNDLDAIAAALGTNVTEFSGRMTDALSFTRRMQVAGVASPDKIASKGADIAEKAAGATLGYGANQALKLGRELMGVFNKDVISTDLAAKVLFTPQGKDFLKTVNLSSTDATKSLGALSALEKATPPAKIASYYMPTSSVVTPVVPVTQQAEPEVVIPSFDDMPTEDVQMPQGQQQEQEIVIPAFD